MPTSDIERIVAFNHRFAKAQASEVIDLPCGYVVLQDEFALSHSHNRLVVTSPATAAHIIAVADDVLGRAGVGHRYVSGDDRLVGDLTAEFVAAGYELDTVATMIYSGAGIEPLAHEVSAVSLDTLRPALTRDWLLDIPDATDEHLRQLADRTSLYERGAELTRLVVFDGGEVAARSDLLIDANDRLAQFEHLVTHPDYRGRGYAQALLGDAHRRSREAGADLFFLTADANDWPYDWYRRCGFVEEARSLHFSRM